MMNAPRKSFFAVVESSPEIPVPLDNYVPEYSLNVIEGRW
jgi:hypothetical protein